MGGGILYVFHGTIKDKFSEAVLDATKRSIGGRCSNSDNGDTGCKDPRKSPDGTMCLTCQSPWTAYATVAEWEKCVVHKKVTNLGELLGEAVTESSTKALGTMSPWTKFWNLTKTIEESMGPLGKLLAGLLVFLVFVLLFGGCWLIVRKCITCISESQKTIKQDMTEGVHAIGPPYIIDVPEYDIENPDEGKRSRLHIARRFKPQNSARCMV